MFMSLVTIGMVLGIGYMWASRGFFSALLNLACTVAAGAVAFAVWEPIALLVLRDVDSEWLINMIWGLSLAVPFAVALALISVAVNLVIRFNVKLDNVTNWLGGAVCGAAAAIITTGIVLISLSMIRSPRNFLGYEAVKVDSSGSAIKNDSLWLPADQYTARFYELVSEGAFSTDTPLAEWSPNVELRGHFMRIGPSDDTALKFTLRPSDVELVKRYTVGEGKYQKISQLAGDQKQVQDIYGVQPSQAYVEGYVVRFKPGAREKSGSIAYGPGFAQLVVRSGEPGSYTVQTIQPFAIVSQAKGDSPQLERWRYDSPNMFFASTGSAADPSVAFEFLIPAVEPPYKPVALYVRGIRFDLAGEATDPPSPVAVSKKYDDLDKELADVRGSSFLQAPAGAAMANSGPPQGPAKSIDIANKPNPPIIADNRIGSFVLSRDNRRGLETTEKGVILNGDAQFTKDDLLPPGPYRELRLEYFDPGSDTVIVQVNVSPNLMSYGAPTQDENELAITSPPSDEATGAPVLYDTQGNRYDCVGFVYLDGTNYRVRFTPGSPITSVADLPSLSKNNPNKRLSLLFRVSQNVSVNKYVIGDKIIREISPPLVTNQPQHTPDK